MTRLTTAVGNATRVQTGLERCLAEMPAELQGKRFGLLMNQASVDGALNSSCDVLARRFPGQLVAVLSPQHGLWCEQQANMDETGDSRYAPLDLPVFSLYGATRAPTKSMLRDMEVLIVDLQDVGVRVYTYAWTVMNCLASAAHEGIPVLILDRPNPLGGEIIEGALLQDDYRSFVGQASIPMRHGLTIAELTRFVNARYQIGAELSVMRMRGWRRKMYFGDTGLPWIPPSPNLPKWTSTLFYPGMVLFEGTNLSEGRGTAIPFEVLGAHFIDAWRLAESLREHELPGLSVRPLWFRPTFDKWRNQSCGGVGLHINDARAARSFEAAVTIMATVRLLWPNDFQWLPPPYEYETEKMPIDIISGNRTLRSSIDAGQTAGLRGVELSQRDIQNWWATVQPFLLYD